jgi:glycerol-3-phosphate dehydrogenase
MESGGVLDEVVGRVRSDLREDAVEIAIVGAGNVGGALARTLSSAGHTVIVTSTSPSEAQALAKGDRRPEPALQR